MDSRDRSRGDPPDRTTVGRSTRPKKGTRPRFVRPEPIFYRCPQCSALLIQANNFGDRLAPHCCGAAMSQLVAADDSALLATEHRLHLVVAGGFDANVIHISVGNPPHPMDGMHSLEWIYLYTFQGGQLKFINGFTTPTVTFALADEDAYVFCDRPVCLGSRCKFNCKKGFTAYAYCNRDGLWKTTL